jgi:hypothetical protein
MCKRGRTEGHSRLSEGVRPREAAKRREEGRGEARKETKTGPIKGHGMSWLAKGSASD